MVGISIVLINHCLGFLLGFSRPATLFMPLLNKCPNSVFGTELPVLEMNLSIYITLSTVLGFKRNTTISKSAHAAMSFSACSGGS